jgi:hypothetical protein
MSKFNITDFQDPNKEEIEVKQLPAYLSPSSLKEWEACPYKFYLKRMSKYKSKIKRSLSTKPAAVGTSFDIYAKSYIDVVRQGPGAKPPNIYQLVSKGVDNTEHREEAIRAGQGLLKVYLQTAGAELHDYFPIKTDLDFTKVVEGVPIRGIIDFELCNGLVCDWKTRGYGSAPKSPTPGWVKKWTNGKLVKKPHPRYRESFDTIHPDWASQVTIYNFGRGHKVGDPLMVGIDELSMRHVAVPEDIGLETVQVTQVRSPISEEFQVKLMNRLQKAWEDINNGIIQNPSPTPARCFSYRQLCEASDYCNMFRSNTELVFKNKSKKTPSNSNIMEMFGDFNKFKR